MIRKRKIHLLTYFRAIAALLLLVVWSLARCFAATRCLESSSTHWLFIGVFTESIWCGSATSFPGFN